MKSLLKRAMRDMFENSFLHLITIITVALSVLIVSAFILFIANANEVLSEWKKGLRIMAYVEAGLPETKLLFIKQHINQLDGVQEVRFISKDEALEFLRSQMKRQAAIFDNLKDNQLPDSFEVRILTSARHWEKIEQIAQLIEAIPEITDVEYGQNWIGRFAYIFNLFRVAGIATGGLFFIAAVFIIANTIRLVLYSRREEIEIMRLVGATDGFIKMPIFIEGLLQGALGGILGVMLLSFSFWALSANIEQGFIAPIFQIRFLSLRIIAGIIVSSMFIGWIGCYLSLKHFLKH